MKADTKPLVWKYAKKYCKSNVFLYIYVNTKVSISSYMISLVDNPEDSKSRRYCGNKTSFSFRFTKTWRLKEKQIPRLKKSFKANPGAIVCLSVCLPAWERSASSAQLQERCSYCSFRSFSVSLGTFFTTKWRTVSFLQELR